MEIINTTLVEASIPAFYLVLSIILWACALGGLILAIIDWINGDAGTEGLIAFLIGALFGFGCFFTNRVKEPYHKYDVVFTGEEINMKEFVDKYTIIGNDGNIYHIEDKH